MPMFTPMPTPLSAADAPTSMSNAPLSGDDFIRIRPLVDTTLGIYCHLLEVESTKIVINCGIDSRFNYSIYDGVLDTIRSADCIIITSFELAFFGAVGLFSGMKIYCSSPTALLGSIVLGEMKHKMESFYSRTVLSKFDPVRVKYAQPFIVNGIEICAYNAGYCIGNSVYRILVRLESILVGFNVNHKKENYLNGLARDIGGDVSTIITNSVYSAVPAYTVRNRDSGLLELIRGCPGRVLISVRYTRLIELLTVVESERPIIIAKNGKLFIDRIRSMIEWASIRAPDIFTEFRCTFGNVNEIGKQKVIIVVNEEFEDGIFGTVLDQFNSAQNTLLLIDQDRTKLDFSRLNAYKFEYVLQKIEQTRGKEASQVDYMDTDEHDADKHWTTAGTSIFIEKYHNGYMFPQHPRRTYNNDYGETVEYNFEQRTEEETDRLKDEIESDVIEVENKELVRQSIEPVCAILSFNFHGISDFVSSKTVIESFTPKQIVLANNGVEQSLFFASALRLSNRPHTVCLCDRKLVLRTQNNSTKVKITEDITSLKFRKINSCKISKSILRRTHTHLFAAGNYPPLLVGSVSLPILRRALAEAGFQVSQRANGLLVNNDLSISIEQDTICIHSGESILLAAIRNILYSYVTII